MMRLNLGCGQKILDGWVNVDGFTGAPFPYNLAEMPWPWDSNSVDYVLASHIVEHFDCEDGYKFMQECYRVLAPDGVLRIAVPDMDIFIKCHVTGDFGPLNGYKWDRLDFLCGGDNTEKQLHQRHKYMYSYENMAYKLREIGFRFVARVGASPNDNYDYAHFSLYVEAHK